MIDMLSLGVMAEVSVWDKAYDVCFWVIIFVFFVFLLFTIYFAICSKLGKEEKSSDQNYCEYCDRIATITVKTRERINLVDGDGKEKIKTIAFYTCADCGNVLYSKELKDGKNI